MRRPRRSRLALVLTLAAVVVAIAAAAARAGDATPGAPPALVAEPSPGCSTASVSRGTPLPAIHGQRMELPVGGDARSYLVDAPASAPDLPRPLVLVFHGFRDSAENMRLATGDMLSAREHAIVVYPEGHEGVRLLQTVGRGWDLGSGDTRDVDFVRALLDRVERERCVDRRRVYATGMSNGGFFASLVGCRLADRIAAIAPVAGVMPLPACTPAHAVAVLLIYGRADQVVPPQLMRGGRDWWAQVDGCGAGREHDDCTHYEGCAADVVACEGPQAHRWPPDALERIWSFFTAHPRT